MCMAAAQRLDVLLAQVAEQEITKEHERPDAGADASGDLHARCARVNTLDLHGRKRRNRTAVFLEFWRPRASAATS